MKPDAYITQDAYTRMKLRNSKNPLDKEETYFAIAAIPAILFAGLIDGGVSMFLAYGARRLYKLRHGI